jgi:hypothetical protein
LQTHCTRISAHLSVHPRQANGRSQFRVSILGRAELFGVLIRL